MANGLYDFGREGFLGGDIAWDSDQMFVDLVDADDGTYGGQALATDQNRDDYNVGAALVAAGGTQLGSKTITAGVADAADQSPAWAGVSGPVSEEIICYAEKGADAADRLVFGITSATGLPVTPNSGDINVAWDGGANKIFKL
jgi:hypothetical protein